MDLTPEKKAQIDNLNYRKLSAGWRSTPCGDPIFMGETGDYWEKRMSELRRKDPGRTVAYKKDDVKVKNPLKRYHHILLNKKKDAELAKWLEDMRETWESPGHAMKRKLYKLFVDDLKKKEE
jgi:hypothetical protein